MIRVRRVGILGGTFDPIHLGHLAAGAAGRAALGLDEVRVVPVHDPPHRAARPRASRFHRFAMAALAVAGEPGLVLSDMEVGADGPSFTATTLGRLHASGYAPGELFFITGSDAFAEIATWHEYPAILDLCHFIVISRPTCSLAVLRSNLQDLAPRMHLVRAGGVVDAEAVARPGVSIFLVEHGTPDVSSSEIRNRLRDGRSITGLVPPAVERYIDRHGLYRSAGPTDPVIG